MTADQISKIEQAFRTALSNESAVAYRHQSDVHFTTSRGRNVGEDEHLALVYAQRLKLAPEPGEDSGRYLLRLLHELETLKRDFRRNEDDPEGFGIATLHGLSRVLEQFRRAGD